MRFLWLSIILTGFVFQVQGQAWVGMLTDSVFDFHETRRVFEEYLETQDLSERVPGRKQFDRFSYFLDSRVDEQGRHARPEATFVEYERLMQEKKQQGKFTPVANWNPLGPFVVPVNSPGMGRVNCIAFHPTNTNIMWVGAASGGVWKTTNGGNYWHPMSDHIASLGISSIVVDYQNPDVVYAATGDFNNSDTYSVGVLKSIDGGNTWNTTGLSWIASDQRRISRMLIHPVNPNIIYAGTSVGIWRTTDGGVNWQMIRSGSISDLAFRPGDPTVIYAVLGNGFWRSTNDGATFSPVNINSTLPIRRAKIAVTPADPNYVYMLTVRTDNSGFEGLYRSVDGGTSFSQMSTAPNILGYASNGSSNGGIAWYCLGLVVSPVNKNDVWAASVNVWRSTNGGSNWQIRAHWYGDQGLPYVHADIHFMEYHPVTGALYICSDGGVDITTNNGASFQQKNNGLAIGQVYRIGLSKQDPDRIIGGWQDNGTHLLSNNTWRHMLGGDGMEGIISHTNFNYMYGCMQYGNIYRTYDGGNNWQKISDNIPEEGSWITPYVMHPTSHNILLAGYNNIWRSSNYGSTWTQLSNFTGTGYYDKFRSLAYAPSNTNYIYAATFNRIYRTANGGQSWVQINNNLPSYPISYISVHHNNPQIVYVSLSGFYNGHKVYMTTNGGQTWSNISGSLPNLPANTVIHQKNSPGGIYVGMDVGVFYRDSTLTDWVHYFQGLPNVKIAELEIHYDTERLVAATYGRGIWWSYTYNSINAVNEVSPGRDASVNVFPNPSNGNFTLSINNRGEQVTGIRIYSSAGILVRHWIPSVASSDITAELQGILSPGIYLLQAELTNGTFASGRIIIRN
jgi:photosystem II stability/assembly factor-like uncharacterized protein